MHFAIKFENITKFTTFKRNHKQFFDSFVEFESLTELYLIITTRNEVGARLCFYRHLWFCPQGGSTWPCTPPGTRYTPQIQVQPPRTRHPPRRRACWEIWSTRGRYASYWNAILLHLACSSYFSGLANMGVISLNWDPHLLNCNISSVWQWNLRLYFDRILPFRRFWMRDSLLRVITLNVSGGYTVRSLTCGLRVSLGVNHFLRIVHTVQLRLKLIFHK